MNPLRPLSLAALVLIAGSGTAAAQTLYVRKAPPASTVNLIVNSTKAGSAQTDQNGDVRIPIDLATHLKKQEIDARVFVDTCDAARTVTIIERDAAPLPPDDGCTRQEITGVFVIQRVSSVVVNVGSPVATLLLRQGSYSLRSRGPRRSVPTGLVAFGGATMVNYADALDFGCTGVPTCSGNDSGFEYTVGAEYWFSKIISAEGSWVVNSRSHFTFKYSDYVNETQGRPDNVANVSATTVVGTRLDVGRLDQVGLLTVPVTVAGQAAFNDFVQPLIDRYGYLENGVKVGGGTVGYGTTFDEDNFFRDALQFGYNVSFGGGLRHELHAGYQYYVDAEDLIRSSNGWGSISVPGGRLSFNNTPIFYTAAFQQQGLGLVPTIHSEYTSRSFELNDTVRWDRWTFNLGLLASNDTLYGQGLQEDASKPLTGFVARPGVKYEMYDIPFSRMIQPRLAATWAYNGEDTIFGSYATYNPAASSLPRAASWDRNLATTINSHFDANGVLFGSTNVASSSGKLFVEDMTPRTIDEVIVGTARHLGRRATARAYWRYRKGTHFWEDTNNNARIAFRSANTPPSVPSALYIEDLTQRLAEIGSGSTYVIAELDGAYTKFNEATVESEWRGDRAFVRGSYTWSHYYGNFDQDNSTTANDANVFVGSSFIGDGAGRQLWDFRDGDMRGDRRHVLKVYGYYSLKWDATVGAYAFAQSGQPWEIWSYEPYIALTTNTSDTSRFAEPAGSKRTNPHAQLDLKYIQNFRVGPHMRFQLDADLFNVFNGQTGYNINPNAHAGTAFGVARNFFDPRRFQIAVRLRF